MEDHHDCMLWDNGHYLVLYTTVYITHEDLLYQHYQVTLCIGTWFGTSSLIRVLSTFLLHILGIVNITTRRVVCNVRTDVYYIGGKERDS